MRTNISFNLETRRPRRGCSPAGDPRLPEHEVTTVSASGWASIKNGKLLALIEKAGFHAFITCDKNMEFQQRQLERRPFAVLLLSTNHWPSIKPYVARIADALERAEPGSIQKIDCGRFIPRRHRKPDDSTP